MLWGRFVSNRTSVSPAVAICEDLFGLDQGFLAVNTDLGIFIQSDSRKGDSCLTKIPLEMSAQSWGCSLLFVLLLATSIDGGKRSSSVDQQKLDAVLDLPGLGFSVSFAHYSGYVTVNQESGRALFYWFFEAVVDPSSKPLVLWLNGGPGCSSIAYGLAEELGPFHVEKDGKTLYWNPYSWNLAANLLFVESPVGVGYSYSNTSSDILTNGDKRTAEDSLEFLLKWFERFPQYKGREFYITGESYAGHYVPQLSQAVVKHNANVKDVVINLKGFMVGNGLTDDYHDHLGLFQFMWASGLISDQTFKQANLLCDYQSFVHPSEECDNVLDTVSDELGYIDPYSIFTPTCTEGFSIMSRVLKRRDKKVGLLRRIYDPCTESHSTIYFNLPEVQKALHVHTTNSSFKWATCSDDVNEFWKDSPTTVLDVYQELISAGLRIWVFRFSSNTRLISDALPKRILVSFLSNSRHILKCYLRVW